MDFATVRLGKTSVDAIKSINNLTPGIVNNMPIDVTCTQIPSEFTPNTWVFIWLGSDNNKGMPTAWKQGFKAFGILKKISRGENYSDNSTFTIDIKYIFDEAISRLDFLKFTPQAYYWFSAIPIIGLDDHSNQTVRMIQPNAERNNIRAFLYAFDKIITDFSGNLRLLDDNFENLIAGYEIPNPIAPNRKDCKSNKLDIPLQVIFYGAPGTGKSYKIKGLVKDGNHVRTTFHPDSDYASFVGAYKPTMIEVPSRDMSGHVIEDKATNKPVKEKKIVYEFVDQAFLQAYIEAWKRSVGIMTDKEGENTSMPEGMDDKYYLVIEEINRGNCAQIFGDLFQLLDRDDNGESSYAIRPDQDIKRYLAEQFEGIEGLPEAIRKGEEMKLPSNLYIFATMNTSDQSLFPIDSAFKRRWDWEYVPIKDEKKGYFIKVGDTAYRWSDFLDKINEKILKATNSDDKQMGYWFVHLPEGQKEITTDKFVGKVLFYLWNDVFKDFGDGEDTIFIGEKEDGSKYELRFKSFFGDERNERISDLMRYNKVEPTQIEDDAEEKIAEELENSDGSINIDKTSTAYNKWKNKHDTYWAACQEAYSKDPILKLGQRTETPNAYDIPLEFSNGVNMRVWHLTHKGEKCMAMGVWIPETTSADVVDKLVAAIPKWNEKLNQKFIHLALNTGSHIRAYSPQYDFNNPEDVEASIEWVKNLAPILYNTVEDTLKGKE